MNTLDGDATNVVSVDPTGQPVGSGLRHEDVRRRGRRHAASSAAKHVLTYGGNLRLQHFDLTIAPRRGLAHRGRRLRPGRVHDQRLDAAWSPARASTSSARSTTRCSRRASRWCSSRGGPVDSRELQPRVPRAVDGQQPPETRVATPLPLSRIQPGVSAVRSTWCRRRPRQQGPDRGVRSMPSRSRTPANLRGRAHRLGRGLLHQLQGRHLLHDDRDVDDAAAGIPGLPGSSPAVRLGRLPAGLRSWGNRLLRRRTPTGISAR